MIYTNVYICRYIQECVIAYIVVLITPWKRGVIWKHLDLFRAHAHVSCIVFACIYIFCISYIYSLLFYFKLGPEPSILGPDPSQTLKYSLKLRSVQILASGVRQLSRSRLRGRRAFAHPPAAQNRGLVSQGGGARGVVPPPLATQNHGFAS